MNMNKCLKWRRQVLTISQNFSSLEKLLRVLATFATLFSFPFFCSHLTTWFCVFSVRKDFSLYARFVVFVAGKRMRMLGLLLVPLEMIYCEKYRLLHYERHRMKRAVQRVHTPCVSAFFMASDSVWMRKENIFSCRTMKEMFGENFAVPTIPIECSD